MSVGYPEGFAAPWVKGLTALVVILAVAISLLLMTILVAKKDMKVLLYKMMPPVVVKKLRRGETVVQRYDLSTIFFSDIVGFTKMSGEMSPLEVMELLNEMYSKFDDLVIKHKVYKVETIG
jgi:class 3 adenylate cyclase